MLFYRISGMYKVRQIENGNAIQGINTVNFLFLFPDNDFRGICLKHSQDK